MNVEMDDLNKTAPEFALKAQLESKRKQIKSFDDLMAFIKEIKDTCNTGYGGAPRAIAQAALATAWFLSSEFGITGFQAGCTMWDFIQGWQYTDNKCGLKIVDYDLMLYPQYGYRFDKTIDKNTFAALQKKATEELSNTKQYVHPHVKSHWLSIVDGKVPFGYTVVDD